MITGLLVLFAVAQGELLVHPLFGDYAVLQKEALVKIWGWTDVPEDHISVFVDDIKVADAQLVGRDADCDERYVRWEASLLTGSDFSNHLVSIKSSAGDILVFREVRYGEVLICDGQSNMHMPVAGTLDRHKALPDHEIRHFNFNGYEAKSACGAKN